MCGISGFIDFNKMSSEDILKNMSGTLSHRGPDGKGFFLSDTSAYSVGLAHQRLAIIDLSPGGHQPMNVNHLWITFNGEIYNFKEIKKELQANGHSFKNDSDTEVILFAYKEWGIKCVEKFIGMFAFVIYDTKENELICARDRAGVKPFYYYRNNNLFLFASEIKAFHKHPGFVKELNTGVLENYLQLGTIPSHQCIFNNCFKLKPGYHLKFNLTTREIKLTEYWNVVSFYSLPKMNISFEEAKIETEKILTSAAEYRMISDVPVGVFLAEVMTAHLLPHFCKKTGGKNCKHLLLE